jgi:hypothetical protein
MYLINKTHHLCERMEYAFNIFPEYSIITLISIKENIMCQDSNETFNYIIKFKFN